MFFNNEISSTVNLAKFWPPLQPCLATADQSGLATLNFTVWLLHINNDISQSSNLVDFHLFADDTSVFCSNKDNEMMEVSLNNELHNISNWLGYNKLSLNVKKSKRYSYKQ